MGETRLYALTEDEVDALVDGPRYDYEPWGERHECIACRCPRDRPSDHMSDCAEVARVYEAKWVLRRPDALTLDDLRVLVAGRPSDNLFWDVDALNPQCLDCGRTHVHAEECPTLIGQARYDEARARAEALIGGTS